MAVKLCWLNLGFTMRALSLAGIALWIYCKDNEVDAVHRNVEKRQMRAQKPHYESVMPETPAHNGKWRSIASLRSIIANLFVNTHPVKCLMT